MSLSRFSYKVRHLDQRWPALTFLWLKAGLSMNKLALIEFGVVMRAENDTSV